MRPTAKEMAMRFRAREEARIERAADLAHQEWKQDQRDEEYDY